MKHLVYLVLPALLGCSTGHLALSLPNGFTLESAKDTSFSSLTFSSETNGAFTISVSNYVGNASSPINADNIRLQTILSGAAAITREAAKGAVEGAK